LFLLTERLIAGRRSIFSDPSCTGLNEGASAGSYGARRRGCEPQADQRGCRPKRNVRLPADAILGEVIMLAVPSIWATEPRRD
jgi:hypothetical protein